MQYTKDRVITINPKQNLVIIKGKDRTDDILRVVQEGEHTVVTYKSGKSYRYTQHNVELFSNPNHIPVKNCRTFVAGDLSLDVEEVLHFKKWVKIFHRDGHYRCRLFSEFFIEPIKPFNSRSKDLPAYFLELAKNTSLKTDEGESK